MTKPRVPMRSVIGRALIAPFYLEAASWKALVRPLITLTLVGLLPVAAGYFHMGWIVQVAAFGFLWTAIIWLAWNFERHLLLGAAAGESDPRLRQRYGLNLLVLVVGGMLLTVAIWHLLQWMLAAIVFLHLAASDNNPLPSVAYVLGWIVAISVAGSFPVRFFLLLPAAAAGHAIAPKRIWHLTRGNGLRLFLVLVILPGVLAGYGQLTFWPDRSFPGSAMVAGLLTAYGGMVYLAVLAWAYRSLSAMPLPDLKQGAGARLLRANARRLWAALAIVLLLFGGVAVYDAIYRTAPGETIQILRFGKPQRVTSDPGTRVKIPFVEETRPLPDVFQAQYQGTHLTYHKELVPLDCRIQWRIVDAVLFDRTLGGRTTRADRMIGDFLDSLLRDLVAQRGMEDIRPLIEAGGLTLPKEETAHPATLLDGVIDEINKRIKVYGMEVTVLRMDVRSGVG